MAIEVISYIYNKFRNLILYGIIGGISSGLDFLVYFLLVNIVSVLVTPQIFCLATGAIISGVREAGANQA